MHRVRHAPRLRRRQRELESRAAARPRPAAIVPPCACTIARQIDRPSPAPTIVPSCMPRWNLSNSRSGSPRPASPGPSSSTVTRTTPPSSRALTRDRVPAGCTWPRSRTDSSSTCTTSLASTYTSGRSAGSATSTRCSRAAAALCRAPHPTRSSTRLPVAPQRDLARLEAHEVEHLRYELRHVARFRLDRARELPFASRRRAPRRASTSVDAAPAMAASGVRRSCEIEASNVLRSVSRSAATRAPRPRLREPRALERQADLARERLEQVPLLGQQHAPRIARQHGQHAEAARRSPSGR